MTFSTILGCATTETVKTRASAFEERADRITTVAGRVIQRVAPLVVAGTCVVQPEFCGLAKAALRSANTTINAIEAAKKEEDDSLKLATLASELGKTLTPSMLSSLPQIKNC